MCRVGMGLFLWLTIIFLGLTWGEEVPEVLVSAGRLALSPEAIGQRVSVLSEEELSLSPFLTAEEALDGLSEAEVRSRGLFGLQGDLSLRGASFEENLVLFEGLPLTDPQTGHHLLNLPFLAADLSALEVFPGGASALYGPGGFGGAVNFRLKSPRQSFLRLETAYGSYVFRQEGIVWGKRTGEGGFQGRLTRIRSQGYLENTDFDLRLGNIYFKTPRVFLFYGLNEKEFGARYFYSERFPWQWERTRTQILAFKRILERGEMRFEPALLFRRNDDLYRLNRYQPALYQNTHTSRTYFVRLPISWTTERLSFSFGLEGILEDLESSRLGDHQRARGGLFGSLVLYTFENFFPRLDIRYDSLGKGLPDEFTWNLSLAYFLREDWRVRGAMGYAYRVPSFTELYYWSPGLQGKEDLSVERAYHYEIGLDREGKTKFSLTLFYRHGRDLIDWVDKGGYWQAENLEEVDTYGITVETLWKHTALGQWRLSYTYLNQVFEHRAGPSRYYGAYLRHHGVVRWLFNLPGEIKVQLEGDYQQRIDQEGHYLVGIKVRREMVLRGVKVRLFFWGRNLLDQEYEDVTGVPLPGVWIAGGLEGEFL